MFWVFGLTVVGWENRKSFCKSLRKRKLISFWWHCWWYFTCIIYDFVHECRAVLQGLYFVHISLWPLFTFRNPSAAQSFFFLVLILYSWPVLFMSQKTKVKFLSPRLESWVFLSVAAVKECFSCQGVLRCETFSCSVLQSVVLHTMKDKPGKINLLGSRLSSIMRTDSLMISG